MVIQTKAPGFPAAEIVADSLGEFIDNSHKEWAFYWGEDVSTDDLVNSWEELIQKAHSYVDGVSFYTIL